MELTIRNIIVVSDTHIGCRFGLCPPEVNLDEGVTYKASALQNKVWDMWQEFHNVWVPQVTRGEPYIFVHNGDVIDGVHHNSVTQISHNISDQLNIAEQILRPIIEKPQCKAYYHIRGTEAHVGKSAQYEEQLAKTLGAKRNQQHQYSRWDMWLRFGSKSNLVHFTHHVGTTNSASYESTAVYKELVEAYNEAGRWGDKPPDVVVRSHRHRQCEIKIGSEKGYAISFTTPGWQLKTPFVYKLGLGRAASPQFGGYLIREGDEDAVFTRFKLWTVHRSQEVKV